MQVNVTGIFGWEQALKALYTSKRHLDYRKDHEITETVRLATDHNGLILDLDILSHDSNHDIPIEKREKAIEEFHRMAKILFDVGKEHIALLRFLNMDIVTFGIHRAGQDDIDAHAVRFNTRIVRASTRLAIFTDEKSDWYKDKIMSTDDALKRLNIHFPESIITENGEFVRCTNGYVRIDCADDKDVLRGLYMKSIPSDFISQINLTEFSHVYKLRQLGSTANPEVQEWAEQVAEQLCNINPYITRELLLEIPN